MSPGRRMERLDLRMTLKEEGSSMEEKRWCAWDILARWEVST
jgi:hypothetical protein